MTKEISDILTAFKEAQSNGRQMALATVVHVEGSSYRRPGARMLVEDNGKITGAISGGCLEGDALKKALLAI
ncbi:XdhC family protein, partial [Acinetobacter baumannii]